MEGNGKAGAPGGTVTLGDNRAAVHRHQFLHDGEAQPQSAVGLQLRVMGLPETFKDIR